MLKNNEKAISYRMTKAMFVGILATRKGREKSWNPHKYVMHYLNSQNGLKGRVTSIQVVDA